MVMRWPPVGLGSLHHIDSDECSVQVVENGPYVVKNIALGVPFNGAGASKKGIYPLSLRSLKKTSRFAMGRTTTTIGVTTADYGCKVH